MFSMAVSRNILRRLLKGSGAGVGFKTGTFTGNGNPTQSIVGVGFQPKFLFIYLHLGAPGYAGGWGAKTDQDGVNAKVWAWNGANYVAYYESDHIISLDADGFTIGDGTGSALGNVYNQLGIVSSYVAFKSGVQVSTGTYTGNGGATQSIVGVGFQPSHIIVYDEATGYIAAKMTNDALFSLTYASPCAFRYLTDMIISLDPGGFTVGDGTGYANIWNVNLTVYSYICWRSSGFGYFKTGTYVGNGAASKSIAGLGFTPKTVIIWLDDNVHIYTWGYKIAADAAKCKNFANGNLVQYAIGIQSLDVDGFTVVDGSGGAWDYNWNTHTYTYIAFG
jgi:hypothetical protein